MALINLKTNLKSLKYGRDQVNGGSSNQPFIQKPLPTSLLQVGNTGGYDSFTRGGALAIGKTADDASRLTKLLYGFSTLQGPLFEAKLNTLSKSNVAIQNNTKPNQGKFENKTLLKQAAYTPTGKHIPLFTNTNGTYLDLIKPAAIDFTFGDSIQTQEGIINNNRLVNLYNTKIVVVKDTQKSQKALAAQGFKVNLDDLGELFSYQGGPGSSRGLGSTSIKLTNSTTSERVPNNFVQLSDIANKKSSHKENSNTPTDFRKLVADLEFGTPSNYIRTSRQSLLNTGDPGSRGYTRSQTDTFLNSANPYTTDTLNFRDLFDVVTQGGQDVAIDWTDVQNDMIPFYFQYYNYTSQQMGVLQFRAFLTGISDNFQADWSGFRYMGRGENFYTYTGFSRNLSFSFAIHAQSKAELLPLYKKLNLLASSTAPSYSSAGLMRGNYLTLTMGDYLVEQPGILKSVNIQFDDNSPWELGRAYADKTIQGPDGKEYEPGDYVNQGNRLPHYLSVQVTFEPIHTFIAERNKPFISLGQNNTGYRTKKPTFLMDPNIVGQEDVATPPTTTVAAAAEQAPVVETTTATPESNADQDWGDYTWD